MGLTHASMLMQCFVHVKVSCKNQFRERNPVLHSQIPAACSGESRLFALDRGVRVQNYKASE